MQSFYFTFGSDPEFPFGWNDYVLIQCANEGEACRLFNAVFPKRPKSNCMNCAFMYNKLQWERGVKTHYEGREPAASIIVSRVENW